MVVNKEVVVLEWSINDENMYVVFNLEFFVLKSKLCGSVFIYDSNGVMEFFVVDIMDFGFVII